MSRQSSTSKPPLSAAAAGRRLLLLSATRWLPVGLVIGVTTLLPLERGLTLTQIGIMLSAQGFVVLFLELPTGGLADAVGRRAVLITAGCIAVVSAILFVSADGFWMFVVAMILQGVFRALDSGPLEAWYVDTAHAADPSTPVETALSRAGAVLGVAIAGGALASGALIAWHPVGDQSPLVLPFLIAITLSVAHLVATAVLVQEPARRHSGLRAALRSAGQAPRVVADGVRLLGTARVLRWLVLVEVFWSVGMIAFETFQPVRLAELVGGEARAGALMGPVAAVAWALFALGSALAGTGSRRFGVARVAIMARVLNGVFVVVMGLATGPVGLVLAYLAAYTWHGAAAPVHNTLLHRQASAGNRTTVLSMNSMVGGACHSVGLLLLGPLAEHTSTATAIIVAGAFSVLGAFCYLPALRAERRPTAVAPQRTPAEIG